MIFRNLKQFIFTITTSSLLLGGLFAAPVPVAAQIVPLNYVVKLHINNPALLQGLATNIEHKFPGVTKPIFQNIYSFISPLELPVLKQKLAGQFEYLEVDHTVAVKTVDATLFPDDPGFSNDPENIDRQWGLHKANFPDAWGLTTGDQSVVVAVIDTGLDATHDDLEDTNILPGFNVITDTNLSASRNTDDNGHGTLITGVIAATMDNNIGIAGGASGVSILPIKALNARGSGSSSNIAEAIVWAADHGANVINMSLGGIGFSQDSTLGNAVTYAFNKDIVLVAAAGNDVAVTGGNLDIDPVFPICNDNAINMIIGVTSTDVNDLKPDFANFGKACIDVSAPGKRILSTINHDPVTGALSQDSYAYASGTSLSTPFVTAQAALLKSLFPFATNKQIRDRIISTSINIDPLNLTQCAGNSCAGLLGGGRIDVAASMEEQISRIQDGDVVRVNETGQLYYINGGKRQLITPFVNNQRFAAVSPKLVSLAELQDFPEGSYAEPVDSTLIKTPESPTIYYMSQGLRLPVTYQVFVMRGFTFAQVNSLANTEVNSWITGSFLTPPEGTLIRTTGNPTVYWVVGNVLHPINYEFWVQRGLNIFPVIYVSDSDITNYPKGDAYIL